MSEHTDASEDTRVVVGERAAPVTLSQHTAQWAKGITPPDLWQHGRPSLKATWVWAVHGSHLPNEDTARYGSRAGAALTLPVRAVLLYLDWLFERPSRVIAAALLVTCLIYAIV